MQHENTVPGKADFEVVDHIADWSIRVRGADLGQLLINAAYGMGTLLVAELEALPLSEERLIEVEAFDRESVLVEWLSELAYLAERDSVVYREFEVHEAAPEIARITARGAVVSQLHKHIKAVTYHNLEVKETAGSLEAEIVFDV
jgi:SHS2 domain-containing protein